MAATASALVSALGVTVIGLIRLLGKVKQRIEEIRKLDTNCEMVDDLLRRAEARVVSLQSSGLPSNCPAHIVIRRLKEIMDEAACVLRKYYDNAWSSRIRLRQLRYPSKIKYLNESLRSAMDDLDKDLNWRHPPLTGSPYSASPSSPSPSPFSLPPQRQVLVPPSEPLAGFVGLGIQASQECLCRFMKQKQQQQQQQIMVVHGIAGVGKTALLANIYHEAKSGCFFSDVLWLNCESFDINDIKSLQMNVAKQIRKDDIDASVLLLETQNDVDGLARILADYFKDKIWLAIFDDVWELPDLQKLGLTSGKGSKIIISSRIRDVIADRRRRDVSISYMEVKPLQRNEAWQLFQTLLGFDETENPTLVMNNLKFEEIAKEVCDMAGGIPRFIETLAFTSPDDAQPRRWETYKQDHIKAQIQEFNEFLQPCYHNLPTPELKTLFLYCACMFPANNRISKDLLLRLWIAEGILFTNQAQHDPDYDYLKQLATDYLTTLENRRLLSFVCESRDEPESFLPCRLDQEMQEDGFIKIHVRIREMGVNVGQEQKNYVCRDNSDLSKFPMDLEESVQRLFLRSNFICGLPWSFNGSQNLISLNLAWNSKLQKIPKEFLVNTPSLKVVDISGTEIELLPPEIGNLWQLRFLNLQNCHHLHSLPNEFCNLFALEFLDLSYCCSLKKLPDDFGNLESLQDLRLRQCIKLKRLPPSMGRLKVLKVLELDVHEESASTPELGQWPDLRRLALTCGKTDTELPLWTLKRLQRLRLGAHHGYRLCSSPDAWSNFRALNKLFLEDCIHLQNLPVLEDLPELRVLGVRGCHSVTNLRLGWGVHGMLQTVYLHNLQKLEMLVDEECEWSQHNLPELQVIEISFCHSLQKLPSGFEKLPKLAELGCQELWWTTALASVPAQHDLFTTALQTKLKFISYPQEPPIF